MSTMIRRSTDPLQAHIHSSSEHDFLIPKRSSLVTNAAYESSIGEVRGQTIVIPPGLGKKAAAEIYQAA
jgi:hypothetical protein